MKTKYLLPTLLLTLFATQTLAEIPKHVNTLYLSSAIAKNGCTLEQAKAEMLFSKRFVLVDISFGEIFFNWIVKRPKGRPTTSDKAVIEKLLTPAQVDAKGKELVSDMYCVEYSGVNSPAVLKSSTNSIDIYTGIKNLPEYNNTKALGWGYISDNNYNGLTHDSQNIAGTYGISDGFPVALNNEIVQHGALVYSVARDFSHPEDQQFLISYLSPDLDAMEGNYSIRKSIEQVIYQKTHNDPNPNGPTVLNISYFPNEGLKKPTQTAINEAYDKYNIVTVMSWTNGNDKTPIKGLPDKAITASWLTVNLDATFSTNTPIGNQIGNDSKGNPIYRQPDFGIPLDYDFKTLSDGGGFGETGIKGSSFAAPIVKSLLERLFARHQDIEKTKIINTLCQTATKLTAIKFSVGTNPWTAPRCGIPNFYAADKTLENPGWPELPKGVLSPLTVAYSQDHPKGSDCYPVCSSWNAAYDYVMKVGTFDIGTAIVTLTRESAKLTFNIKQQDPSSGYWYYTVTASGKRSVYYKATGRTVKSTNSNTNKFTINKSIACPEPGYIFKQELGICSK